jgi:hypothetical protein
MSEAVAVELVVHIRHEKEQNIGPMPYSIVITVPGDNGSATIYPLESGLRITLDNLYLSAKSTDLLTTVISCNPPFTSRYPCDLTNATLEFYRGRDLIVYDKAVCTTVARPLLSGDHY